MVAYNFKTQFSEDVAQGRKRQTIRAQGKRRHARPGDMLQLYTGMRSRSCRKLREDVPCRASRPIFITDSPARIVLDGRILGQKAVTACAEADGFQSVPDMFDFFRKTHGLPFEGVLIQW